MRCSKCGYVFDKGSFCPECGAKYDAEDEKERELKRQEDREKRELEKEKAKVEQERLAKERTEKEVELLKLRKEEAERIARQERENEEKRKAEAERIAEAEKKRKEEEEKAARTFNGVEYRTLEEAKAAAAAFAEERAAVKAQKMADAFAVLALILGIAAWPLTLAAFGAALTIPAVILGIMALQRKTTKKSCAIGGIFSVAVYIVFMTICLIFTLN